jgi:hypothetical protein
LNPDSAVAIDRKREVQSLRSEVDRFLPLSIHQSAVLQGMFKRHRNDVLERKMTLKLHKSDAFTAPELHLASGILDLTAESGLNPNLFIMESL